MTTDTPKHGSKTIEKSANVVQDADGLLSLCKTCQVWLIDSAKSAGQFPGLAFMYGGDDATMGASFSHHKTYGIWKDAMDSGCYICCNLKSCIPSSMIEDWIENQSTRDPADNQHLFNCEMFYEQNKPYSMSIRTSGYGMTFAARTVVYEAGGTTNSSTAWGTIAKWLDHCTHKHDSCAQTNDQSGDWYPTRLLDLGAQDDDTSIVRMIETAQERPKGPYVTLSHCWGQIWSLRLTKENRADFLVGVPALPKTFEEAVLASRKLGGNEEDWTKEASLMHLVYSHAWCNLSATASRDSSQGLFRNRSSILGELVVDVGASQNVALVERDFVMHEIEDSPLQNRAWVLQERLLSPRVLHFGERQIFWECNQLTASEAFPDGLPDAVACHAIRKLFNTIEPSSPIDVWSTIVVNYTSRSITYGTDKLPALSGISKHLRPFMGGTFLAGVWSNNSILYQLAWYASSALRPRPEYRAPTWSWASVDGPVALTARRDYFKPEVRIIDAQVTLATSAGAVAGGFLLVEGPLKRLPEDQRETFQGEFTVKFDTSSKSVSELYFLQLYSDSKPDYTRDREGDDYREYQQYLVLVRDPNVPTSCRRYGLASTYYDDDDGPKKILVDAVEDSPCEEYLGPEKGHRIRIF
ncbi:hypothetical protein DL98DRAFT_539937 [Cadophora sp. DSE1049]|nr:hypothetical protein DL98DRAFT_539937 [Cadophora sp. DSE1049]